MVVVLLCASVVVVAPFSTSSSNTLARLRIDVEVTEGDSSSSESLMAIAYDLRAALAAGRGDTAIFVEAKGVYPSR